MTIAKHHLPRSALRQRKTQTIAGVSLRVLTVRERKSIGDFTLDYLVTFRSAQGDLREKYFSTLALAREFFDFRVALARALRIVQAQAPRSPRHAQAPRSPRHVD
jgi:hypothetical protein